MLSIVYSVLCVGLYIYLYYSLVSYDESVVTDSSTVYSVESEKDSIQKIQRLVATTTPDRAYLDSLFVPSDGTANFIQNLENLADDAGVSHTLSVNSTEDGTLNSSGRDYLVFSLGISGSWQSVYRFVSILENLPYKISISTIHLNISDATKKPPLWSSNITFTVVKNK